MSEPIPKGPFKPGELVQVVADNVEEVVYREDKDTLLELYAPFCDTCKLLKFVLAQAAEALSDVPTVVIAQMNGQANYKPGFLPIEEASAFPLLKIFPGGDKSKTAEWPEDTHSGVYNAASVIRFIHKHAKHKFDLDKALQKCKELDVKYQELMFEEAKRQAREFALSEPQAFLLSKSPCRAPHERLMTFFLTAKYSAIADRPDRDQLADELSDALRKCMKEKAKESYKFWEDIEQFAGDMKLQYLDKLPEEERESLLKSSKPKKKEQKKTQKKKQQSEKSEE